MNSIFHRDRIVRATLGSDPAMAAVVADPEALALIANYLHDCETAFAFLRNKGWEGSLLDIARAIPEAK